MVVRYSFRFKYLDVASAFISDVTSLSHAARERMAQFPSYVLRPGSMRYDETSCSTEGDVYLFEVPVRYRSGADNRHLQNISATPFTSLPPSPWSSCTMKGKPFQLVLSHESPLLKSFFIFVFTGRCSTKDQLCNPPFDRLRFSPLKLNTSNFSPCYQFGSVVIPMVKS